MRREFKPIGARRKLCGQTFQEGSMKKLYVVGIGPGDQANLTHRALAALQDAHTLCGYYTYLQLIAPLFPDKPTLGSGMKHEIQRCHAALQTAAAGQTVAMICSGDPGVYGMAGLIYQLAENYPDLDIEIVPGVSAALAGAALLGAPLMHDFAVISLSDLLTPWDKIARRLAAAAAADFVICLYNPASKKRRQHLAEAGKIVLQHRPAHTPCGWVRNAGRDGEVCGLLTLEELAGFAADMFTTIFIGNSATQIINGKMVTPRGYQVNE